MRRTPGIRRRARISGDDVTVILAFALKRSVMARLQQINRLTIPAPAGTEALTGDGVQVNPILPANPDRICVYGTPVRSTREYSTAERVTVTEQVTCEIRVRVYRPGQDDDDDVSDIDLALGQQINAVAVAILDGNPIVLPSMGALNLSEVLQWPTALSSTPEPAVMGLASIIFTAELVSS
jgi:hypothetical protein